MGSTTPVVRVCAWENRAAGSLEGFSRLCWSGSEPVVGHDAERSRLYSPMLSILASVDSEGFKRVLATEAVAAVLDAVSPSRRVYGIFGDINTGYIFVPNFQPTLHEGRYKLREASEMPFEEIDEDGKQTLSDSDSQTTYVTSTEVVGCRVLSEDGEIDGEPSVNVLAPGYGIIWVAASDLVDMSSEETEAEQSPRRISSLRLSFGDRQHSTDGLYRFLQLVGSSLLRLELAIPADQTTLVIHQHLSGCPNLTALSIEGLKVDAAALIGLCRHHQRWFSELNCEFESLLTLALELMLDDSLLVQNLKCLTITTVDME